MASDRPSAASAVIPFPVVASPAPTSPNAAARSSTVTRHPACASATADASPAIPPPTTVAVSSSAPMGTASERQRALFEFAAALGLDLVVLGLLRGLAGDVDAAHEGDAADVDHRSV